jgi:AcrR family transcriptional regulator
LLDAAGGLLARGDGPRNLQQVAAEAGLAAATAYRHFASLEDVLQTYAHQTVLAMVSYASGLPGTGAERLRALSAEWVRLISERGPAMVHLRSRRGFLERRLAGDPIIADTCSYLEPAVSSVLSEHGLHPGSLEVGLFLWNALFDPREILDLTAVAGWTQEQVVDRLMRAFLSGLCAAA